MLSLQNRLLGTFIEIRLRRICVSAASTSNRDDIGLRIQPIRGLRKDVIDRLIVFIDLKHRHSCARLRLQCKRSVVGSCHRDRCAIIGRIAVIDHSNSIAAHISQQRPQVCSNIINIRSVCRKGSRLPFNGDAPDTARLNRSDKIDPAGIGCVRLFDLRDRQHNRLPVGVDLHDRDFDHPRCILPSSFHGLQHESSRSRPDPSSCRILNAEHRSTRIQVAQLRSAIGIEQVLAAFFQQESIEGFFLLDRG